MMFPIGIAKSVYRAMIKTNTPANGTAVDSPLETDAIVLKQSFIAIVTIKVNKKYVLYGL